MIKFTGINHLAMVTGDMDGTIRFWRDLLGMRLVAGLGEPGYRHYFFEISANDLLAFFEWPQVEKVEEKDHGYPVAGPVLFDHISFGVETYDQLWELKDKLTVAGFPVSGVIDHGFILSIYTWDPNGLPIEFSFNKPEVDIRSAPKMADRQPTTTALEGPEPQWEHWPSPPGPTTMENRRIYSGVGSELFHGTRENES
jgi:catechol 2,3-dioxygenase-like lactoylglutathione lyase family enzyme